MRRVALLGLMAWSLLVGWAAAREPSTSTLLRSNSSLGYTPSLDSGLRPVRPCSGAAPLQPIFRAAAAKFQLDWAVLAALTETESSFGCNLGPSSAGAVGWTQFMPGTWRDWGMDADGDGRAQPGNAVDAVYSAARYLRVNGAPRDYHRALLAYNHAEWYVRLVLQRARRWGRFSGGEFAQLAGVAQRALGLQTRLVQLGESIQQLQEQARELRQRQRRNRRQLAGTGRRLQRARERFELQAQQLNRATAQYVRLTRGLAQGAASSGSPEQQLLEYVASASPGDALVVYASARALLQHQAQRLQELRAVAARAQQGRDRLGAEQLRQQQLASQLRGDQKQLLQQLRQQRQQQRSAWRALADYQTLARRYALLYQQGSGLVGNLQGAPWQGLQARLDAPGRLRWPLNGPVVSGFGRRCLDQEGGRCRPHQGLDIAARTGTPIHVSAAGRVSRRQLPEQSGGYGRFVCVEHGGGLSTCYAHLSSWRVRPGQRLRRQQILGRVGCTGHCFGPHLHFEVRQADVPVDPVPQMPG